MNQSRFTFSEYLSRTVSVQSRLVDVLRASLESRVQALIDDVPELRSIDNDGTAPLTLAFVGQYNAGKSTIISALTNRGDITIDANVCTDTVTAYDWDGIQLLDTPGIHAGYPDHDEQTYRAIDRADLVVFVITSELFDDVIGGHFRELAFGRSKAQEMVLVVNKVGQDPGTAEVKRPDIEKVTRPLPLEGFRTVFIDALAYVDALEERDAEDRAELLEIAGFKNFVSSLNSFVVDRGLMGRLTTPVFGIGSVAGQAKAYLDVDAPEERAALELLSRKQGLFVASRASLRGTLSGLIGAAASDVVAYGDEVAESIEPGSTEESVKDRHEGALCRVRERCTRVGEDVDSLVQNELCNLKRQLDSLHAGVLARELRGRVETALMGTVQKGDDGELGGAEWGAPEKTVPSDWQSRMRRVGEVANKVGRVAGKWTTGPLQGARIGSATAARGSQGQQVIYQVGKFFGHNFKPWGAVNAARAIGNAGRVVSAVGGVLGVIAQVAEDRQKGRERRELRDARDGVRAEYRKIARAVEENFWSRFNRMATDVYDSDIAAIEASRSAIVGDRDGRTEASETLGELRSEAAQLIRDIQQAAPMQD